MDAQTMHLLYLPFLQLSPKKKSAGGGGYPPSSLCINPWNGIVGLRLTSQPKQRTSDVTLPMSPCYLELFFVLTRFYKNGSIL